MIAILRAKPDVSLSDLRLLCARGRFGGILGTLTLREYFTGEPDETIDPITGAPDKLARRRRYDDEVLGAHDRGEAEAAGDDGRVRSSPPARGEHC